jgi:FtsP/CotA-like multicopper oxidase with cupredoxin domain
MFQFSIKYTALLAMSLSSFILVSSQDPGPCYRYPIGSNLTQPLNIYSSQGYLDVSFDYQTGTDDNGNDLFCYVLNNGLQSPTLRIIPGDHILLSLKNDLMPDGTSPPMNMDISTWNYTTCGSKMMTSTSTNLHFHGSHTIPKCHRDDVVTTIVNSGESFNFDLLIPTTQPPGLYWYHPHLHGIAEAAVLGGATGAIVVEGIEQIQPKVAGLPEQIFVVRDMLLPDTDNPLMPAKDISVNYVPIFFPDYVPPVLRIKPLQKQFWRVLNAAADTILNLQLMYDGVPQPLEIVALDGVPVGSMEATQQGSTIIRNQIVLPPAGRAEFIITGPTLNIKNATFLTLNVDTGPDGDVDPTRPLTRLIADPNAPNPAVVLPSVSSVIPVTSVATNLLNIPPKVTRRIYFSEEPVNATDPNSDTVFYVTEVGEVPKAFDVNDGPSITTQEGTVEDWIVENHSFETHSFHIHQIHFLVLEKNGTKVSTDEMQYRDTINVPFWSGNASDPYPSVKLRMDFTGAIAGFFVYHCHILEHEDKGMMAMMQVLPASASSLVVSNSNSVQTVWNPVSIGTTTALIVVVVILLILTIYLNRALINSCFAPKHSPTNLSKKDPELVFPPSSSVEIPAAIPASSAEAPKVAPSSVEASKEVPAPPAEASKEPVSSTAEAPKVLSVTSSDTLLPPTAEII